MKKYIVLILASIVTISVAAQINSSAGRLIVAAADMVSTDKISPTVNQQMRLKLQKLINASGLGGSVYLAHFVVKPSYEIINKEIVAGAPTKYFYEVNIQLTLEEITSGKIFDTFSMETKSVGNSEPKAIIASLKEVDINNREVAQFITSARAKIMDYYDNIYQEIIQKALALSKMNKEDEAIYTLMQIPEGSKGYESALKTMTDIYGNGFAEKDCRKRLLYARAIWANTKSGNNINDIIALISGIDASTGCYDDFTGFVKEVDQVMRQEENKVWNYFMTQQQNNFEVKIAKIDAVRAIGMAYAYSNAHKYTTNHYTVIK